MKNKRLLISTEYFKPGIKAGGIIEAALNLAKGLSNHFEIYILTSNRDLNEKETYQNLIFNTWLDYDQKIKIYYLEGGILNYYHLYKEIRKIDPHVIFLNGIFSFRFNILPVIFKYLGLAKFKIILSPRGMLKGSALKFKKNKKMLFLTFFKLFKLNEIVHLHTTDNNETFDTVNLFGNKSKVCQIFDLLILERNIKLEIQKEVGSLKCLFVGRIHPIKNLLFFINLFKDIDFDINVEVSIIGPVEDINYWKECLNNIKELNPNVKFIYYDYLPNFEILKHIEQNHLICNPSFGENFGYTIVESLVLYRPVLISDMTPWRNLNISSAGWDLPLDDKLAFVNAINQAAHWNNEEFKKYCNGAKAYIEKSYSLDEIKMKYIEMFS